MFGRLQCSLRTVELQWFHTTASGIYPPTPKPANHRLAWLLAADVPLVLAGSNEEARADGMRGEAEAADSLRFWAEARTFSSAS